MLVPGAQHCYLIFLYKMITTDLHTLKRRTLWYEIISIKLLFKVGVVAQMPQFRRPGFNPWVSKIAWRMGWLPTLVFLPGEFHGQRRLMGCPWGHSVGHNWVTNTQICTYTCMCVCINICHYPFTHQWVFRLSPYLGYHK